MTILTLYWNENNDNTKFAGALVLLAIPKPRTYSSPVVCGLSLSVVNWQLGGVIRRRDKKTRTQHPKKRREPAGFCVLYPWFRLDVVGRFNSHLISGDPAPVTTART